MTAAGADIGVVALDVGGSSIKSGVVFRQGPRVEHFTQTRLNSAGSQEHILEALAAVIRAHRVQITAPHLCAGVAFGFPNPFDYAQGISQMQHKFASIQGIDLPGALRERLHDPGLAVKFRNDAEAAVVGEAVYGMGRPYRRLIGVTLGTGLGSSFVVDGARVASGPGVPPDGWLWPVAVGEVTADDLFSTRGLRSRLVEAGYGHLDAPAAAAAARGGDAAVQEAFAAFGSALGDFLAPYVLGFQAQAVVVLGGIGHTYDLFGPALDAALPVPALLSSLGGHAPLLGAAALLLG